MDIEDLKGFGYLFVGGLLGWSIVIIFLYVVYAVFG